MSHTVVAMWAHNRNSCQTIPFFFSIFISRLCALRCYSHRNADWFTFFRCCCCVLVAWRRTIQLLLTIVFVSSAIVAAISCLASIRFVFDRVTRLHWFCLFLFLYRVASKIMIYSSFQWIYLFTTHASVTHWQTGTLFFFPKSEKDLFANLTEGPMHWQITITM